MPVSPAAARVLPDGVSGNCGTFIAVHGRVTHPQQCRGRVPVTGGQDPPVILAAPQYVVVAALGVSGATDGVA